MEKVRRVARSLDVSKDRLRAIEAASEALFAPFGQYSRPEFFVEDVLGGPDALNDARVHVSAIGMLLDGVATELLKQDSGGLLALKDRIDGLRRQCVRAKEDLTLLFLGDNPNFVRWGTQTRSTRRGVQVTLNWTPISVAPILAQSLWKEPREIGAALVSATLSTDGGFGYFRERLGIPKADPLVTETIVGSPFDYPRHCLLYIPRHLPPPSDDVGYAFQICEEMIQLIELSQGGAFLLFTSHRALNVAYDRLTQSDLPYPLLRQGEMPNARLIEIFKAEGNAVPVRHPVVLGGRGRPRRRAAPGRHRPDPVFRPGQPAAQGPCGGDHPCRRRLVRRLRLAAGPIEAQAGLRASDPYR